MTQRYPILVYADTSVYGGVFDDEFADASSAFFTLVRQGGFNLFVSEVIHRELGAAPQSVQDLFDELLPFTWLTPISEEALNLRDAYLQAGILTAKYADDALHVALATVAGCDMIVSWNFTHIVNFRKIPLFNAVNALQGYKPMTIYSPFEVTQNENQEL
jgi:predicted nucleic acid-binding protein